MTMRLDDEVRAAVEVACAEETFEQPDKENLRFIMARLRGLVEREE